MTGMIDPKADLSYKVLQYIPASITVATIAVILRLWSRWLVHLANGGRQRLWWDDRLILVALGFSLSKDFLILVWKEIGLGKHVYALQLDEVVTGLKLVYSVLLTWGLGMTFVRMSVLFFYARTFNSGAYFRKVLWIVGGINIAWGIAMASITVFQCTPISKAWRPWDAGHCVDHFQCYYAFAWSALVVDTAVLLLPVPLLLSLKLSWSNRLLIAIMFVCGYGVFAVAVVRVLLIIKLGPGLFLDPTFNLIEVGPLFALEHTISIFVASLPMCFTLLQRVSSQGWRSLFHRDSNEVDCGSRPDGDRQPNLLRVADRPLDTSQKQRTEVMEVQIIYRDECLRRMDGKDIMVSEKPLPTLPNERRLPELPGQQRYGGKGNAIWVMKEYTVSGEKIALASESLDNINSIDVAAAGSKRNQ